MDDDQRAIELLLNSLARVGEKRCRNFATQRSSVIHPNARQAIERNQLKTRWRGHKNRDQLAGYHVELLCRAEALLQFIKVNVGPSAEFPLVLVAETSETAQEMDRHSKSLEQMIEFMKEI